MCPKCFGAMVVAGALCAGCHGHGTIEVQIAQGELYTLKCKVCGFENGGRIVSEEFPLRAPDIGCVKCGVDKDQVEYVKVVQDVD